MITTETSEKSLIKEIGKPSSKSDKNGEITYMYDKIGLPVGIHHKAITIVGINFNWDGDKHFSEKSYTGIFTLGDIVITKESKIEDFKQVTVLKFDCSMSIMCFSKNESIGLKAMAGFDKKSALSQFIFMLKNKLRHKKNQSK